MDVVENPEDEWFTVQNCVRTGKLGQNLSLNASTVGLDLEEVEYEPKQFPGLIYCPEDAEGVVLLFITGKAVITSCRSIKSAEEIFAGLTETVSEFL